MAKKEEVIVKKIWESWTFWFNVLAAIATVATALIDSGLLSGVALQIFSIVMIVGNVLLRMKTSSAIKLY